MPDPNQPALEFLLSRRSRPAKTLVPPAPDHATLETLLRAAMRSPDHGKLEPWRFIVLEGAALERLADLARRRGHALGLDPDRVSKVADLFARAPVMVAVVSAPVPSDKVPEIEQRYSAAAAALQLLNAALAAGWGANWLTGFAAHDREFVEQGLGLTPTENIVAFMVIGTQTRVPPERPRPDLAAKTRWVSA